MKRVLIVYKYVPQYRQAFFDQLKTKLAEYGTSLELIYGDPTPKEALKSDAVYPVWGRYVPHYILRVSKSQALLYQPVVRAACQADLVIVEHANRLLVNIVLTILSRTGLCRVAFWGHGKNFQHEETWLARSLKRLQARQARWWFAYNDLSAEAIRSLGISSSIITPVMNSIDTSQLRRDLAAVSTEEIAKVVIQHKLTNTQVCLFIGGMYGMKRLAFLLEACTRIHEQDPSFRMIFIGSGEEQAIVGQFALVHEWCLFKGALFGVEKAVYLKLAKLILMPGLVGLVILDSFAAGVPIVTTGIKFHSPEIEYLVSGDNGVMVTPADDVDAYAQTVFDLLRDEQACFHLRAGCRKSADAYNMQNMVERFAQGVQKALINDPV